MSDFAKGYYPSKKIYIPRTEGSLPPRRNPRGRPLRKKRGISRKNVAFGILIFIFAIASFLIFWPKKNESILVSALSQSRESVSVSSISSDSYRDRIGNEIYSHNALLIDLTDRKIIAEKNSAEMVYPASLTKIMTVLVALENINDFDGSFKIDEELNQHLIRENASVVGFAVGEPMTVEDMLYGTMLASGADAAAGLACYVCGSQDAFVELMNQKAQQIGMKNTHFANVTGLHDEDHYTTPIDFAKLLEYALKNEKFYQIFTTKQYTTSKTEQHRYGISVSATWLTSLQKENKECEYILGGKTGFTDEAAQCLATLAEKSGKEYILLTFGAGGGSRAKMHHLLDAVQIYDRFI